MLDEEEILAAAREAVAGAIAVTPTVKIREIAEQMGIPRKSRELMSVSRTITLTLLKHPEQFVPVYHERSNHHRTIRYFAYVGGGQ